MQTSRPVGFAVPDWTAPPRPSSEVLDGQYVRLEPLSAEAHAALLYRAYQADDWVWDYMPYGPFHSAAQYHRWVRETVENQDHFFYAIYSKAERTFTGVASYLRIYPERGSIEVGNINFAPVMQGTPAATEAMFLMMQWAFDVGYRLDCDLRLSHSCHRHRALAATGTLTTSAYCSIRSAATMLRLALMSVTPTNESWPASG